jgi:hypothetical protein
VSVSKTFAQNKLPISAIKYDTAYKRSVTAKRNAVVSHAAVVSTSNIYDRSDVQVFPSGNPQSEVHLSINPVNPQNILLSCNTVPIGNSEQGYYYSNDFGQTWTGQDYLANGAFGRGDPSTAFDASGNAYLESMSAPNLNADPTGFLIQKSANGGATWGAQVRGVSPMGDGDKPMIAADNVSTSPYKNNVYCAWGHSNIYFNRSITGGAYFTNPVTIQTSGQGTNIQTGPNGEVYLCYAYYASGAGNASGIQFFWSNDGLSSLVGQYSISFTGIRTNPDPNPLFNGIGVNDFPSMAVDKSTGPHRGRRYIVAAGKQNGNGKAVILLAYSDDNYHFSAFKQISIPNATQSWFPWISVDDTNGDIYVDYYAFDTSTQWETNTYVAFSNDGSNTFSNQKVSDVSHTTAPIPGFLDGYTGDYIGIAAHGGKALASWTDNRSGIWQVYVSEVGRNPVITGVTSFCSSATYTVSNVPTGSTVTWSASPSGVINLSPSGNQVSLTRVSQGYVTLTATISGSYSDISPTINITTFPNVVAISSSMSGPCTDGYQSWYLSATTNAIAPTSWQWGVQYPTNGTFIIQSPNSPSTYVRVKGGGGVTVTYTDACGDVSPINGVTIWAPCQGAAAVVAYPNPASNQLTVKNGNITTPAQAAEIGQTAFSLQTYLVELYDGNGKVRKTAKNTNGAQDVVLVTSDLLNGTYYLHIVQSGRDIIEKQIIIQH